MPSPQLMRCSPVDAGIRRATLKGDEVAIGIDRDSDELAPGEAIGYLSPVRDEPVLIVLRDRDIRLRDVQRNECDACDDREVDPITR